MNRAAVALSGGAVVVAAAAAAGIAYDYKTCHPMRQMNSKGYEVSGAGIRLHNFVRRSVGPMPTYTLADLARYDGEDRKQVYFSANGLVYDVTSSEMFESAYSLWKGKDASVALATMSMNERDVNRTDWESLSAHDIKSLESWSHYFNEKYMIKGKLKEFHEHR